MSISIPLTVLKELCKLNQYSIRSCIDVETFAENSAEALKIFKDMGFNDLTESDIKCEKENDEIRLLEITLADVKRAIYKVEKRQEEIERY